MTEPPFGGGEMPPQYQPPPAYAPEQPPTGYIPPDNTGYGATGYEPPVAGYYGSPGQFPPPVYPAPGPIPGYYVDPVAPYGRHPFTGEPLSDKSKLVAGLLQLIGLFGILGIGRLYLGYTGLGIAQLLIGIFGGLIIGFLTCGVGFLIPVVWAIVDSVMILSDKVCDPQGRPLRDG
jgi:TM2 domain-containing membrane protein YozV